MFNKSEFWKRLGLVLTLSGGVVAFIAAHKENEELIQEVTEKVLNTLQANPNTETV